MKTILALVDFSDASTNSVLFAAELAKRSAARLVIVNILQQGDDEAAAHGQEGHLIGVLRVEGSGLPLLLMVRWSTLAKQSSSAVRAMHLYKIAALDPLTVDIADARIDIEQAIVIAEALPLRVG